MKLLKIVAGIGLFFILIIVIYKAITGWTKAVMEDKPRVNYSASKNIQQAKNDGYWIASFNAENNKYFSNDKTDSLSIKEVWIEENRPSNKGVNNTGQYAYILNVLFNWVTDEDLHKFRLLQRPTITNHNNSKIEYPDATPSIRYLLKHSLDTVKLELIERNPNDSLVWMTETVIDTIVLSKVDAKKSKS